MKTKVVVISAILVMLSCNMAVAQWPVQTYGVNPTWEFELGTRIMDRPVDRNDGGIPLISNNLTLQTLFDSDDATDLNTAAGVDFRVARTNAYYCIYEFRGYYNSWDRFQNTSGDLTSPLLFGVDISNVDYTYTSEIYNLEFNLKKAVHPGLTLLMGPRFYYLQDHSTVDVTVPLLTPIVRVDSETTNPMIGLNLGAEVVRPLTRDSHFRGFIKGAIFANPARAEVNLQSVVNPGSIVLMSTPLLDERATHASGLVELGGRVNFDIVPGNISLYVGWEGTWVDGVATAPAQILVTAVPELTTIHTSSTPFIHGLVIGGNIRF